MSSESTSARLRQVQEALAASQQDLTHVEGQLRDAERDRMRAERQLDEQAARHRVLWGLERDACVKLRERLTEARTELEELRAARQWVVARDGGRWCERCEQEVRRGEAYEEQPGTGGLIQHIHCPNPISTKEP